MSSSKLAVVVVAALLTSVTACSSSARQQSPAAVAPLRGSQIAHPTGNALRFGSGVTPVAGVVYQPDVVLIQGGPAAVRAVSASD